jgi:hypothetical protein
MSTSKPLPVAGSIVDFHPVTGSTHLITDALVLGTQREKVRGFGYRAGLRSTGRWLVRIRDVTTGETWLVYPDDIVRCTPPVKEAA